MNINEIFDYLATTDLPALYCIEDLREVDWEIDGNSLYWIEDTVVYEANTGQDDIVCIDNLVFINAEVRNYTQTYLLDKGNQILVGSAYV